MTKNHRLTIAAIVSTLESDYHNNMFLGITETIKDLHLNFIGFPGGALNSPDIRQKMRNLIYNHINPKLVDGLIIPSSSISRYITQDEYMTFLVKLADIPVISIGYTDVRVPFVNPDYKHGIKDILTHLIEVHNCRHIALVRGPAGQSSSIERYEAFCTTMHENGLNIDPDLIVTTDFVSDVGKKAFQELLDTRKRIDAILTFNDRIALEGMEELKQRNIRVPADIIVAGFQGKTESYFAHPSLTTVDERPYALGAQAVLLLNDLIHGKKIPEKTYIKTELITNESCGCSAYAPNSLKFSNTLTIPNFRSSRVLENLFHVKRTSEYDLINAKIHTYINAALKKSNFWKQKSIIINTALELCTYRNYVIQRNNSFFQQMGTTLVSSFNFPDFVKILKGHTDFHFFYIALYKVGDFSRVRLVHAFEDGQILETAGDEYYPADFLVPRKYFHKHSFQMIISPLFYDTIHLGFMAYDIEKCNTYTIDALQSIISSAFANLTQLHEKTLAKQSPDQATELLEKQVNKRTIELLESLKTIQQIQDELIASEKMAILGKLSIEFANKTRKQIDSCLKKCSDMNSRLEDALSQAQNPAHNKILTYIDDSAEYIINKLENASSIIANFRQISLDQALNEKRVFNLKEYIYVIIHNLETDFQRKKINVTLFCPENLYVNTYPGAVYQIFVNLFTNSITHGFENTSSGRIEIQINYFDNKVIIHYKDNGRGIEESLLPEIFKPFFTTKKGAGGSGLGMQIIHDIVYSVLKGELKVTSGKDKGMQFQISFNL